MPQLKRKPVQQVKPVWDGPESNSPNGGITFSLLGRFLSCRERFRITVVDGVKPNRQFSHRVEYGNMWHVCEEAFAKCGQGAENSRLASEATYLSLLDYTRQLCQTYHTDTNQILHWYNVCKTQFPLYVNYWSKHPDVLNRTPLVQEQVFNVPYKLPSGRTVRLRGKWDSVDLLGTPNGIYLQENKTKGDIKPDQMKRQLSFDLQTMLYTVALTQDTGIEAIEEVKQRIGKGKMPHERSISAIKGVRYNVVRRPLSGGKGNIKKHQPTKSNPAGETDAEFYARLWGLIAAEPDTYFMRWKVELTPGDVDAFRRQCLDPILEQLCCWYDWVVRGKDNPLPTWALSWRHPFGVYNVLDEGGSSDLDEYLLSGSTAGLRKVDNLFPELT